MLAVLPLAPPAFAVHAAERGALGVFIKVLVRHQMILSLRFLNSIFYVLLLWGMFIGGDLNTGQVQIRFATRMEVPAADIPNGARNAGLLPDTSDSGKARSNIRFGIVRDIKDHGAFSRIVAGNVIRVTVTWSDQKLFGSTKRVENFIQLLLTDLSGSTYTYAPWAQRLGIPSVAAELEDSTGNSSKWTVWYAWPSVYCAYRDNRGKWWFGVWFHVQNLRLNGGGLDND